MELKYLDKVRITKGFYEGLEGCVHDERHRLMEGFNTRKIYKVSLKMNDGNVFYEIMKWINEEDFEKIEGDKDGRQ